VEPVAVARYAEFGEKDSGFPIIDIYGEGLGISGPQSIVAAFVHVCTSQMVMESLSLDNDAASFLSGATAKPEISPR